MRVFAVSGYSGTGKTSLIVSIIHELTQRGHRVATVKSSKEDILPPDDTDTGRHLASGSSAVVLIGPDSTTVTFKQRKSITEISQQLTADYLIVEGMKHAELPRFWCVGDGQIDLKDISENTKAIITWEKVTDSEDMKILVLTTKDVSRLADIIETEAIDIPT